MLIDRLLANLSVRVEPFVLCQLSSGWRMHLPGPPGITLHYRRLPNEGLHALPWLTALKDRRLARAIDTILDGPADEHTVESLAEAASMSRSTFAERFSAAFGRAPMSFVHHIRMQRAVELLESEKLTIDEVAMRVGFASRSHFSRAFKKHTGATPDMFRRAAQTDALFLQDD